MLFSNVGGLEIMFHSNLKLSNYCASQIKSYPKFYQNLIQLWADVSEEEPKDVSEICEEIIWNNRMISSNCQILFNKCFIDKGILRIRDIIDVSGSPLCWSSAQQKYSPNNLQMLIWLGLIRCISRAWRNKLTSLQNENCDHIGKKSLGITSKTAYQKFLKPLLRPPTVLKSLEQAFNLNNVNWGKMYLLPRVTTIDSSLRSFQYKILNNTLQLNECLFKFNIVDSPLCLLCRQGNESVIHLFAICSEACSLWEELSTWTSSKNIILPSNLVPQVVILGVLDETMQDLTLVNHLILIFKRYIYLKRKDHIASQRQKLDYHHKNGTS